MPAATQLAEQNNRRGLDLFHQERFAEAEIAFTHAIQCDPYFTNAWKNRALANQRLGRLTEALRDIIESIRCQPEDHHLLAIRADIRREMRDLEGAIDDYTVALITATIDEQKQWLLERARTRRDLGLLEEALGDCNAVLQMEPTSGDAYEFRGQLYLELQNYQVAIADLNRALVHSSHARIPGILLSRANIARMTRRYEAALEDYDRALAIDPSLAMAYLGRGHTHYHLRDERKALADYKFAAQLDLKLTVRQLVRVLRQQAIEYPHQTLHDCYRRVDSKPRDVVSHLRFVLVSWLLNLPTLDVEQSLRQLHALDAELLHQAEPLFVAILASGPLPR